MRSSFFEFHVAASGLFTAKSQLAVTSHNIANAAEPGYCRQLGLQRATTPLGFNDGRGMVGTGSEVYGVAQARDIFLDKKYWEQRGVRGEYLGKTTQLSMMENVFNEMGGSDGLASALDDFFAKASDLSTTTNDSTYRINLIQTANTLAEMINTEAMALRKQQIDANAEIAIVAEQINSLGVQIASLNKQIALLEADGSSANDLRDERARLVDELSELVNLEAKELDYTLISGRKAKRYVVMINGYDFVNQYEVNPLAVEERPAAGKKNPMDAEGLYDIHFTGSSAPFDLYHLRLKGQLKGLIDIRDGNGAASVPGSQATVSYKGIPYYMNRLNNLVRTLAKAIDEGMYPNDPNDPRLPIQDVVGHVNGWNLMGDQPGTLFFTYEGGPEALSFGVSGPDDTGLYEAMDCLNFQVNPALRANPALLNCSASETQGESAYDVTKSFSLVKADPSLFKEGKLLDFVTGLSSEMGIDAAQAAKFEARYEDVAVSIDNQRIAVSGVDLNEEMIFMIKNQQLYQAAARLVNTINGIYDFMINRMGA
ncbi:MAG: flagellar hook-associated protein FlgK [Clostridiales bacterium]|jgi:flagellar hook-associated protein 1 FlgK|nr:flagellar hook-associated protein FlgK [Clostridiales bacterium]